MTTHDRDKIIAQQARIEQLEAEVERLKTTPAHKREDLRCVISDLCEQVRAREEQLEAVTNQRDEWVKTACKLPEVSAALKFAVEQGVKFQQQLAECQAALALKDKALESCGYADDSTDPEMCGSYYDAELVQRALDIQPDDSALKAWLGEPVAWADAYGNVIRKSTKEFSRNSMTAAYSIALYSPNLPLGETK